MRRYSGLLVLMFLTNGSVEGQILGLNPLTPSNTSRTRSEPIRRGGLGWGGWGWDMFRREMGYLWQGVKQLGSSEGRRIFWVNYNHAVREVAGEVELNPNDEVARVLRDGARAGAALAAGALATAGGVVAAGGAGAAATIPTAKAVVAKSVATGGAILHRVDPDNRVLEALKRHSRSRLPGAPGLAPSLPRSTGGRR